MGLILLLAFAALEIALAVLTIRGHHDRLHWRRNKTIVRAIELAVLALVVIFPTGMKWRFVICMILLGLRLAIAGIGLALRSARLRKNGEVSPRKSPAGTVIGTVISIVLLGTSLIPAFLFTGYKGLPTSGDYKVKETSAILVDESRMDPWEQDSKREVPIHFYYPEGDAKDCPFVLFAHGSFGYYQSNSSLYEELASHGYVVASIDHPHYAFFTEDTAGQTIIVDMQFMQNAVDLTNGVISEEDSVAMVREWLDIRSADENFALDSVKAAKEAGSLDAAWYTASADKADEILHVLSITDTSRIGLTGHSIGGAVGVKLGRERDDITAVVNIDGTMLSEKLAGDGDAYTYIEDAYPIPFLDLNNDATHDIIYDPAYRDEDGRSYINVHVLNNAVDGRELHFDGSEHMDFTDLPLLSPTLAKMFGKGTVDSKVMVPELNKVILNYFDYYLKGEGELMVSAWEGC